MIREKKKPTMSRLLLPFLLISFALLVNAAPSSPADGGKGGRVRPLASGPVQQVAPSALFFEGGSFIPNPPQVATEEEEDYQQQLYEAMAMEEQQRRQFLLQQQQAAEQEQMEQELMLAAAAAQARAQREQDLEQQQQQQLEEEAEEEATRERFARVLAAVAAQQQQQQSQDYFVPATSLDTDSDSAGQNQKAEGPLMSKAKIDEIKAKSLKAVQKPKDSEKSVAVNPQKKEKPVIHGTKAIKTVPAKKGQYEFVEFAEPLASAKLRGIESMGKRVPAEYNYYNGLESGGSGSGFFRGLFTNSSNLIFIAAVAMCCAVATVGVAGGAYYYNRVRAARDDPFDEFMRYSPTGPGRDKLKKAHLPPTTNRLSPTSGGPAGDDMLTYKAQLHHYQQAKQRIVGGSGGALATQPACTDDEDFYDDDDDELNNGNNFSVYECPGLAPAGGDIAVENPNFVGTTSPSPAPSPQQQSSPSSGRR